MDSSYYTGNALTLSPITEFVKQIAGGNWGDEIYSVTSGARNPQIFERMTNWWHNQVLGTGDSSEDPDAMTSSDEKIKTMTQAEEVSTGASKGGAYGGISQASSAAYLTTKRRGAAPQTLLTAGKSGARATVQRRTAV